MTPCGYHPQHAIQAHMATMEHETRGARMRHELREARRAERDTRRQMAEQARWERRRSRAGWRGMAGALSAHLLAAIS